MQARFTFFNANIIYHFNANVCMIDVLTQKYFISLNTMKHLHIG